MKSFLEFIKETAVAPKSTDNKAPASRSSKPDKSRGIGDTVPDEDITDETISKKKRNVI